MKHSILLLSAVLSYHSIMPKTKSLKEDFAQTPMVDQHLKEILDAHRSELESLARKIHSTHHHGVWQFDWLPVYTTEDS